MKNQNDAKEEAQTQVQRRANQIAQKEDQLSKEAAALAGAPAAPWW
jgi:hypothetical protein